MNRYGAVSSLDFLSEDDIYNLAMEFFTSIRKKGAVLEDEPDDLDSDL